MRGEADSGPNGGAEAVAGERKEEFLLSGEVEGSIVLGLGDRLKIN